MRHASCAQCLARSGETQARSVPRRRQRRAAHSGLCPCIKSRPEGADLEQQKQVLEMYCARQKRTFEVIADLGSGINYRKKVLKRLLEAIIAGQVGRLRFRAELIFSLCTANTVEVVINQGADTTFEDDLAKSVPGSTVRAAARTSSCLWSHAGSVSRGMAACGCAFARPAITDARCLASARQPTSRCAQQKQGVDCDA